MPSASGTWNDRIMRCDALVSLSHHSLSDRKRSFCFRAAAAGAPFHVTERETGRRFLAQLRALDESLARNIQIHNSLDHPNIVQFHQAVVDQGIAVLVYEK